MSTARERLLAQFRELATERLEKVGRSLVSLESGANVEAGRAALRELHGLKGEARMMGFADVNAVVHEMEEVLRAAQAGGYALHGGSVDALLVASDAVGVLTGAVKGEPPDHAQIVAWLKQCSQAEKGVAVSNPPVPQPPPSVEGARSSDSGVLSAPPPPPSSGAGARSSGSGVVAAPPSSGSSVTTAVGTVSSTQTPAPRSSPSGSGPPVSSGSSGTGQSPPPSAGSGPPSSSPRPSSPGRTGEHRLDSSIRISQQSLETITSAVTGLMQRSRRREVEGPARRRLGRELVVLHRLAEDLGPAGAELASRLGKVKELHGELARSAAFLASEEQRELTVLNEEIQALRMLPVGVLFEPYPRMVRELAKDLGKELELTVEGEDARVDRSVLDALKEPLLHLVRNAIDHGVESPSVRAERQKPPKGQLQLSARRDGDRLVLRVQDDGAGIEVDKLRALAADRGVLSEADSRQLTDAQALDLIFLPGFSSRAVTTDVSGRGVGLDVVRMRLISVAGEVTVTTTPGQGSVFELRVPVSLTLAPVLFVQTGEERVCLSAANVTRALAVEKDQLVQVAGKPAVRTDDRVLPFASIASVLGLGPERPPSEGELVLVIRGQGQEAALAVDRVLEERVQAILPLKGMLAGYQHLSGATPMADGTLAMVLSAAHLVASVHGRELKVAALPARKQAARRRRILVVDDSPLTRELLVSLLESVGYEVAQATDGSEALEKLSREPQDLVVTDLEMPKVDGLELTRRLKSHPTLSSLPVVIVTTRGSDADRQRGMQAGADGYVAKGDLVRQDLVDVVSRLLA